MSATKNNKPTKRGIYAWTSIHAGSMLVYHQSLKDCYEFIFLPGPSTMHLSEKTFVECINTKVLEFVEVLPQDVFQETVDAWKKSVEQSSNIIDGCFDEIQKQKQ